MPESPVRVRFAPSPTGYLHVGGVRTALFNWLFARQQGGKFILRIEDTDRVRSTTAALNDILNSLKWLKLDWDEGPYYQSLRLDLYKEYAEKLLQTGSAYKSDQPPKEILGGDSPSVNNNSAPGEAIVFKSIREKIVVDDIVHGRIEFDAGLINDFVIVKSDGMPTYQFACVVDDALMRITHVIRGDDHISNTPKQVMLYKMLGFAIPHFAHVPMIMGPDGGRLSKRHGATSVGEYQQQGYLAPALLNFLALLGWSPGDDKEILPLSEMTASFKLERVTGKSAVFNVEKLSWMNGVYLSQLSDQEMISLCVPYLEQAGFPCDLERAGKIMPLFKKRIKTLPEIVAATNYFFQEDIEYEQEALGKFLKTPEAKLILQKVKEKIAGLPSLKIGDLETALHPLMIELGIKPKILMQTIRVALTGRTASAGIFETIIGLGKELVLKRLERAINL